jgi:hypothetical protein
MQGANNSTEGFVYLRALSPQQFALLIESLFLPRDEWRRRLGVGKREFTRFAADMPVFVDPISKKKCLRGADILAGLRACGIEGQPVYVPAYRQAVRVELKDVAA